MKLLTSIGWAVVSMGCLVAAGEEPLRAVVTADPGQPIGAVSPLIYGGFLEHFHRCIYGGIFEPGSPLSDKNGFRQDVIAALRRIHMPILRWPGGLFASDYHWKDAIGKQRAPDFDKAWRVEEPNAFGTGEFIQFCRAVGAEPYICGSPTVGDREELSDWVEYCNLNVGKWGRLRIANGFEKPYGVRFWSIGNENYGGADVAATNSKDKFAELVQSHAEMMWRADRSIQIVVPFNNNIEWGQALMHAAGAHIRALAVHLYSDGLWEKIRPAPYLACVKKSLEPEALLDRTRSVLHALGADRVKIAVDEWNLRGWHHPRLFAPSPQDIAARDLNDLNSTYTCADAVYAGCLLIACQRHADRVLMANFAPIVNVRGAIFTHPKGIVLRSTYHVFDLIANHALPTAVRTSVESSQLRVDGAGVPVIDAAMTCSDDGQYALTAVNRHDRLSVEVEVKLPGRLVAEQAELWTVTGPTPDSFNDIDHPGDVKLTRKTIPWAAGRHVVTLPPHSVNVLRLTEDSRPSGR